MLIIRCLDVSRCLLSFVYPLFSVLPTELRSRYFATVKQVRFIHKIIRVMKSIAIVYGSTTGNTKEVAEMLKAELKDFEVSLFDVANRPFVELAKFQNIILGTSTWGAGDIQDDWELAINDLKATNLVGKVVALFGLGSASGFADTFVDGMGTLYDAACETNCKLVGATSAEGYGHSSSTAVRDGKFVGLAIDHDNESNLTPSRIAEWVKAIAPEFV